VLLACENCGHAFESEAERDGRCPKCLRKTSVAAAGGTGHRADAPAPWPTGTGCPLCAVREVSDAVVHVGIGGAADTGPEPVAAPRRTLTRLRTCTPCRARVVTLSRLRALALPLTIGGLVAWPICLKLDGQLARASFTGYGAMVIATVFTLVVAGVPLVLVDRAYRSLRRDLEASWLFGRMLERAGAASRRADVTIVADAPTGADVVDAATLVRPADE